MVVSAFDLNVLTTSDSTVQIIKVPMTDDEKILITLEAMSDPLILNRVLVTCAGFKNVGADYLNCISETYSSESGKILSINFPDREVAISQPSEEKRIFFKSLINIFYQYSIVILTLIGMIVFSWTIVVFDIFRAVFRRKLIFRRLHAWTVEAPPILGISGTLYSLMTFLFADSNFGQISGFLQAFSSAAMTTLIGGLVSVFNSFAISFFPRRRGD